MDARSRKTKGLLANVLAILVVVLPPLAEPLAAAARSLVVPSNCSGSPIALISGDAVVTLENPSITNASQFGCNVSGQMHMQLAGNDVGNNPIIPIAGRVDAYNAFTSSSIGAFDLDIAGLTLKVGANGSSFNGGQLLLSNPKIKIPDSWGGLEATVPQAFTVNSEGLNVRTFRLPAIETKKLTLELWGDLGLYTNGYKITAHGALMLPDVGGSEDCFIKVDVSLYVDAFGYTVMEIHTPEGGQADSLVAHRSEIARPAGQAALIPASMPLRSSYLPVPPSLSEEVRQQLQNEDPPPADLTPPTEPSALLGAGEATWAPAQDWTWAEDGSADGSSLYDVSFDPQSPLADLGPVAGPPDPSAEPADVSVGWGGLDITASWKCIGKGIPIGATGFQLTAVEGEVRLLPYEESVRLQVTFNSMLKIATAPAVSVTGWTTFQWSPEFAFSLGGVVKLLSMFEVGGAQISVSESDGLRLTVWWAPLWPPVRSDFALHAWLTRVTSCAAWSTVCYDHHPLSPTCISTCSDWNTQTKFHFTGSAACEIGFEKGQLWSGNLFGYPCGCHWCRKWWGGYPCCRWCWVSIDIPPFTMWLAGASAEFGEFTGDRWGLKGTISFLGFTTGFYVDHTGTLDFGDVSSYKLVDSEQMRAARAAWRAATLQGGPEAAFAGDETFTFPSDDQVLVHFDLPLADPYRLPLRVTDVVTHAQVISQTDTIFSVKADVPLTVTLISPDGVEITPDNYGERPGGYAVQYTRTITTELISAAGSGGDEARWRFIPASNVAAFRTVDVKLDGTTVFAGVSIDEEKVVSYVDVATGTHTVAMVPAGGSSPLVSAPFDVVAGKDYTVLAVGDTAAQLLVLADDNRQPAPGTGRVRVVDAAPTASPLDVTLDGLSLPDVAYPAASDYQTVTAGGYSLTVASAALEPALAISLTGGASAILFGDKVAKAGDVNGDGYDDLLVGDNADSSNRGKAYLYLGTAGEPNAAAAWTKAGENPGDKFGISVAGAGDVNGDGYDDVLVGAYGYSSSRGKVYLYLGSAAGLSTSPVWTATGENAGDRFGGAVAGTGDVNGDGYADILVGADGYDSNRGKVYVYCGTPSGNLSVWRPTGSLGSGRADHTATLLADGRVLVAGSYGSDGSLASAELYDPATRQWTPTGDLNTARSGHTATLLTNGKVLVVGGSGGMSSAELYDPVTGQWTPTGSLTTGRDGHTATRLANGKVLVAGGGAFGGNWTPTAELYDPATGQWTPTGNLNTARRNHAATLLADGRVMVVGGNTSPVSEYLFSAELYNPATGSWTTTGSMTISRQFLTATTLANGRVLAAGGGYMGVTELYNPATGTWTTTGSLGTNRYGQTATLLPGGQVLVVGGYGGGILASSELYDPASGQWTPVADLGVARDGHTATLLPDGRVLVAGGYDANWHGISSAELYGNWSATGEYGADRFGASVAGAGDVNGDGYDDVLVGAYTHPSGDGNRGKAYLYQGGAAGLPGTPSWTAEGEDYDYEFGISVAGAGDVNGDGYDDVVVGAHGYPNYTTNQGKAYLYHGSPAGLSSTADWTATGENAGDHFGASVAGAGDVDRDGYADVLIGAYGYPNGGLQGKAYLYSGSAAGLPAGWMQTGSLGTARQQHTATLLPSGQVLVAGGSGGLSSAELYDPGTGQWTPTGSLNTGHQDPTATRLADGRVLVAGGWTASAERYDPATGLWTPTGSLNTSRAYHTATRLADGRVLVVGGEGYGGYLASAELYDPATGLWTPTGSLNAARSGHTATLLADGRVLAVGGYGGGDFLSSAELYDPATGLWTYTGDMGLTRSRHTATRLADGRVLVAGGEGYGGYLASAQLYDPATGKWTPTGSLSTARLGHTATLLADGRVLAAGGKGAGWLDLSSAEVYDPATGLWTAIDSLNTARWLHTVTLLRDGRVLVVGGESGGGAVDSAELYALPWTATGASAGHEFGISVAGAGDINGDAHGDLVVGAPGQKRAHLYYGDIGLRPTQISIADGDVQTLVVSQIDGSPDPLALLQARDAANEEVYGVVTTTLYIVDQAITGTWTVNLEGDTEEANLAVSAVAAPNPPILGRPTVDASDLAHTQVSYRLLSDYRPVTMHIFANDGPLTQTTTITLPLTMAESPAVTRTEVITLFQGIEVATLVLSNALAVQDALITTTVDLSFLESGNYKLWVRVEDGVSPPVQGYVWGVGTYASGELPRAWNRVRIAAEDYDPGKQMAGAAQIVVDHSSTWAQSWVTTMATEIISSGLHVEFSPYNHPDVDGYLLEVTGEGQTHVITTGNTLYFHYDENGQPVGDPVHYATFKGLSPRQTYTLRIAALDLDSGRSAWSQAQAFSVPVGQLALGALQGAVELPAGQELVTATLVLTMSQNLFSDVVLTLDSYYLPPGIALKRIAYEPLGGSGAAESTLPWQGIPAPARLWSTGALSGENAPGGNVTLLAHATLTVTHDVPAAEYLLPFVAYSGELERRAEVRLRVGEAQEVLVPADATEPVVLHGDLPIPSCATAIQVTIPPGAFDVTALVGFQQGSSNVADWRGMRFAGSHFSLTARDEGGTPIQPLAPLSLDLEYDPVCMGGLREERLHLRSWMDPAEWSTAGITCTPDPPGDVLHCSLLEVGELAMFEPARIHLPLVVKNR